jgi:hypothetical protein
MRRFLLPLAISLLVIADVSANDETLSFRLNGARQVEAVISGMASCTLFRLQEADSVDISPSAISINSVQGGQGGGCPVPLPPPIPYQVVAVLGELPRQTYTVNWTFSINPAGPRLPFRSAALVVDTLFSSVVPTMSSAGVAALALLLSVAGWFGLRRR